MSLSRTRRRQLRKQSTEAELFLWHHLRSRRFQGLKFRRQHPCGPFILDFFCPARRLAIELDGGQHFDAGVMAYDQSRTAFVESRGIRVVRFNNDQVFRETEAVLEWLAFVLGQRPSPRPSPRSRGERE